MKKSSLGFMCLLLLVAVGCSKEEEKKESKPLSTKQVDRPEKQIPEMKE